VDYIAKTLFRPLLDGRAANVEVKEGAEEEFVAGIDEELTGTVFSANCSNWYINEEGRNSASWPGFASTFWYRTLFPKWNDFVLEGGSISWIPSGIYRSVSSIVGSKPGLLVSVTVLGLLLHERGFDQKVQGILEWAAKSALAVSDGIGQV
jgi:hypothetical protein